MLKAYDDYKAGMGDQVVEWIKDQTRHRQGLETLTTHGSENRLNTAQSNAFKMSILGMLIAAGVAYWNTVVAVAIVVVAIGGPPVATIIARIIDRFKPHS